MSPSKEIIDLVSSDDEEDNRKRELISNHVHRPGKKPYRQRAGGDSKKASPADSMMCAKKTRGGTGTAAAAAATTTTATATTTAKTTAPSVVVIDDASNDNAIITYGLLELLSEHISPGSFICTGGGGITTTCPSSVAVASRRKSHHHGQSKQQQNMMIKKSTLCHIKQNDKWSCGFRNLQMMLTAMIPHMPSNHSFFRTIPRRHPDPAIPSLRQIQSSLENAWKAGFDPEGAQHFHKKIVGRASKIGAVEVSTVLTYCGIDSTVVQFAKCRESREMLPKFIRAYFTKAVGVEGCSFCSSCSQQMTTGSHDCAKGLLQLADAGIEIEEPACDCPLFPLYLQWEGHSVSVVGIDKDTDNIFVFDPMKDGSQMKSHLSSQPQKKLLGKSIIPQQLRIDPTKALIKKDTQIVICSFRSLTHRDKEDRIVNPSIGTAAYEAFQRALARENQGRW